jgi:PAS domain S-box-containing protein
MKLSPQLRALFALALFTIVGTTAVSYRNTRRLAAQARWVEHTYEVREAIAGVLSSLQDAETGQRGFVLTGDESHLEPYNAALRDIPSDVRRLEKLTADNPTQQKNLAELQPHIDRKIVEMRYAVERRRRDGLDAAVAVIKEGVGKREMDAIRATIHDMEVAEGRLLRERARAAALAAQTAAWTFATAVLLASTLMGLLYLALRRHLREREELLASERAARADAERAVAEQQRVEAELRRVSEFNETIIGNMGEGLYTVDANGMVTSVNPAAEQLFGWTRAELLGRRMHDVIHYAYPDGSPFPAEECSGLQVLRDVTPLTNHEDVFIRKDGTFFPVLFSSSRIESDGRVRGLVVVFRDITQWKKAEGEREALLAATERSRAAAESANRAKDAFLATVSHELRTPLSPILAWGAMLERGSLDADQSKKALQTIQRCARAQAQLVEDLLDVSRIIAGKMRVEVRPVELRSVIEAAVEVVRPAAEARNIRLQVVLDTETAPVSGDPDRLQQVVWNLLTNALKFTPKGGRVSVVLERVNSHVEIAVSDSGQGIDPQFLPYVFDRFQQADATSTRSHMGLGLGLAIVRHIVEAHGGTVHVESPGVGMGSVFTVKLPLVLIQRKAGEALRRHPTEVPFVPGDFPMLDGLRVLVVDDEPDSNEAVRMLFSSRGAEVRVAASAAQALDILGRWKPEILVSDVGMPDEDGYSLIAKVRARQDGSSQIPAIALTAYASTDDRVRLLSAGFTMHVPKPVEPAELLAVVARAAATRAAR